ncbi:MULTISPECIES: hypothetical protein [unclassified Variovorax]|uniref:hypothetical protein n=1 Tax=unclassified Variovorax TaxID=663243 RepID=UPI003F46160D
MTGVPLGLPLICFVVGMLGAGLGAWLCVRSSRAQLETQRHAFEQARDKAERDLQQALLCVPQWMQQTVRVELEFLGRQQTERWKELVGEQQRRQAAQDGLRKTEWQALLAGSSTRGPLTAPAPVPVPAAPAPTAQVASVTSLAGSPEPQKDPRPLPDPVTAREQLERELTDEEIDALPPDLPVPTRLPGRKLPAPKRPVLRNL